MPESLLLPDLRHDFASSLYIRKSVAEMTAGKSKEMLQRFKVQLVGVIDRRTRPRSRANQLSEDDPDRGSAPLENCVGGDDQKNFL